MYKYNLRKLLVSLVFAVSAFAVQGQDGGIQFINQSWAAIKAEAAKSGKLIFLDAFTSWCGPCKLMAANVFPLKEVGAVYNRNFINAAIDMEKGEGLALSKAYQVHYYPTYLFINAKGEVVHKVVGQTAAADFIQYGLNALSPENNLHYLEANYRGNEGNFDFVIRYLKALNAAYEKDRCDTVALNFLMKQDQAFWLHPESWQLIREYVNDPTSTVFMYLLNHQQTFEHYFGDAAVKDKIYETYLKWPARYVQYPANGRPWLDEKGFNAFLNQLQGSNYARKQEVAGLSRLTVYFGLHNWKSYALTVDDMLEHGLLSLAYPASDKLYSYAENIKRFGTGESYALKRAVDWAKMLTEKATGLDAGKKAAYLELYASLLEASGNTTLANATRKKIDEQALKKEQMAAPFQMLKPAGAKNK